MKKHLFTIGTFAMVTLMAVTACSDNDSPEPPPPPEPEYLWLVDKISQVAYDENEIALSFSFSYNDDFTLASITETVGNDVCKFGYDAEGRLNKVNPFNKYPERTFTYSGNTITMETAEVNGNAPSPTVIHLDGDGFFAYKIDPHPWDPDMEIKLVVKYDDKHRVVERVVETYSAGEIIDESGQITYTYDDRNPILHGGALPQWYYYATDQVLVGPLFLSPVNNLITTFQESFWGAEEFKFQMEYDDDDYPIKWFYVLDDESTAFETTITYKQVEIEPAS